MKFRLGQKVFYLEAKVVNEECPLCKGKGEIKIKPKKRIYTITCPHCKAGSRIYYKDKYTIVEAKIYSMNIHMFKSLDKKENSESIEYLLHNEKNFYIGSKRGELLFSSRRAVEKKLKELEEASDKKYKKSWEC